jgi:hypothetical protein
MLSDFAKALLMAVLPFLVQEAELLFSRGSPQAGPQKKQWVLDMVHQDIIPAFAKRCPSWLQPDLPELEQFLDDALEKAVSMAPWNQGNNLPAS